jgi:hypothetical protein
MSREPSIADPLLARLSELLDGQATVGREA